MYSSAIPAEKQRKWLLCILGLTSVEREWDDKNLGETAEQQVMAWIEQYRKQEFDSFAALHIRGMPYPVLDNVPPSDRLLKDRK
ncbi:hypothetical protein ACQY0O_006065 [Thecaphora frezii]